METWEKNGARRRNIHGARTITSRGDKCGSHFVPAGWAEKMVLRFITNRNQDRDQESRSAQGWVIRQKSSHRGSKEDERPIAVTDAVSSCLIWNLKQWQVFDLPPKTLSQDSPSLPLKRPKLLTLWYPHPKLCPHLPRSPQDPSGPGVSHLLCRFGVQLGNLSSL